ncbi:MAG: nuclear transport factor 2 family protein [Flavobacteriales bacterium]
MIRPYPLLLLLACSSQANAQSEEREILHVIDRFFHSMTARDTAAMSATVLRGGSMQVASLFGGEPAHELSFKDYLVRLAKGKERYVERYWNPRIDQHGPSIATATMEYDFHVDGRFSHCGVDVFTMVKQPDGWRIANVAYTRQTEGCRDSPLPRIEK